MPKFALSLAFIVLLAIAGPFTASLAAQQWVTSYYETGNGVLPITAIPWSKYTHIVHFCASTPGDGTVSLEYMTQSEINNLVAARPPGEKVLACIKDRDSNYNALPQSSAPARIAAFVNNIAAFVRANGYDGVDIDWEKNVNTTQFIDLITRLRAAMPDKLITMAGNPNNAAGAGGSHAFFDQVNVMCYDFDWDLPYAWYVGALLQGGRSDVYTCDWDIAKFTSAGVPAAKIGVGMPFYGRRWTGATQALQPATFNYGNTVFYRNLIADSLRWQPEHRFYDTRFKANYLSIPALNEFVSYTGPEFIRDAVAWQKAMGFGGLMTYSLYYEYLPNEPGDAAYPLSSALYAAAYGGSGAGGVPVNSEPPSISGAAQQGETLVASVGTWTQSPSVYSFQWERCGTGCTPIAGANGQSYSAGRNDLGFAIRVAVTAQNAAGSATAASQPTEVVQRKPKGRQRYPALTRAVGE